MNYPFILKFSKIRNLSDARYAAGMWADFIGFSFDPSDEAFLEPNKAIEIKSWVNGPSIVGEFGNQPIEWIQDITEKLQIKVIEIPQDYPNLEILNKGYKLIVRIKSLELTALAKQADMLITDQVELLQTLDALTDKAILLDLDDLSIDAENFSGVSLIGKHELVPGTSNQSEWTDFLERFEID